MSARIKALRRWFDEFARYLPLLKNLVSRELKKKYRRSVLGYAWCVLNPLLVMLIMNFVFSNMFRNNIANFPVYLFVGRMFFSFITDSTNNMARSVVNNSALMRKTRLPYYIFPLSNFLSNVVNFLFSLIAFVIVLVLTRTPLSVHVVMFPVVLLELFLFSYGLGLFLGTANTFVRDTAQIYGVVTTGWMYLTPLFYPLERLPEYAQKIIMLFNPAYSYIQMGREIFLYNQWPSGELLLRGLFYGLLFLTFGLAFYNRSKNKFILYI